MAYDSSENLWTVARRHLVDGRLALSFQFSESGALDDPSSWTDSSYQVGIIPEVLPPSPPHIATDGNGKWAVVWQQQVATPSGNAPTIQIATATSTGIKNNIGNPWTIQQLGGNGNPTADSSIPRIATDGSVWVVVWGYLDNPQSNKGKVVYMYSTDLTVWDGPHELAADANLDVGELRPDVVTDGDSWMIVWSSLPKGVFFRTTDDPSVPWKTRKTLVDGPPAGPVDAAAADGHWLIAWESGSAVRYVDATTEALLNSTTFTPVSLSAPAFSPKHIRAETDGETWLIACHLDDGQNGHGSYVASRCDEDGPFSALSKVTNDTTGERYPSVAVDDGGHWLAAFEDDSGNSQIQLATGTSECTSDPAPECAKPCEDNPGIVPCRIPTTNQSCDAARVRLWAEFEACVTNEIAEFYELGAPALDNDQFSKCRGLLLEWPDPCPESSVRFVETDNGHTITDNLTNLVWERKAKSGLSAVGTWSVPENPPTPPLNIEDGSAFSAHLSALNTSNYAGASGWRLPTIAELVSTLGPPTANPTTVLVHPDLECRDRGSFAGLAYWSSTAALYIRSGTCPENAWNVIYGKMTAETSDCQVVTTGWVAVDGIDVGRNVRAVRGGL